ncbi:MAG: hypothetical protein ACXVPB_11590, partial [Bacteroidia bacterium]
SVMKRVLFKINTMHSKRAMGFTIKGLYYYNLEKRSDEVCAVIKGMANRLEQMYKHASEKNWLWFEGYIETADCVLSEALLYAYLATGEILYKDISKSSFDFLLTHTFDNANSLLNFNARESDRTVLSHMIHSLVSFYKEFKNEGYRVKVQNAFGLFNDKDSASDEKENFSISATTTVNYLHARLAIESCLCKSEIVDFVNEKSTMNHAIFPISYSLLPVKRSA